MSQQITNPEVLDPSVHQQSLGLISFINSLPITYPLETKAVPICAQLIFDNPAGLNARYSRSELNIGAMSSFYYLSAKHLRLVENISISAIGPVGSVLFFSKQEPRSLCGQTISLPSGSATAAALLKILLAEHYGVMAKYEVSQTPDLHPHSAALVIGDRALAVDPEWSKHYIRIDLAKWWHDTYNLPMVFGVWAAHQEWINCYPTLWKEFASALVKAKELGLTELFSCVLAEAQQRSGLTKDRLEHYFRNELNFDFTEAHRSGLEHFHKLACRHGLL